MQTVVIVDDELIPRRIAEKALEEIYTVYSYEDARTAFSELPVTRPDILLVDLHMPDMDGYAILNAVRQLEDSELCGVPVVIMTSDDHSPHAPRYPIRLGFRDQQSRCGEYSPRAGSDQ